MSFVSDYDDDNKQEAGHQWGRTLAAYKTAKQIYSALILWNSLPAELRCSRDSAGSPRTNLLYKSTFLSTLKTYLFHKSCGRPNLHLQLLHQDPSHLTWQVHGHRMNTNRPIGPYIETATTNKRISELMALRASASFRSFTLPRIDFSNDFFSQIHLNR